MRCCSCTMGLSMPIRSRIRSANQPTERVSPVPRLIVMPSMPGAVAAAMKPATVSVTNVMSRSGVSEPSRISSRTSACEMIVGMKARALWRGPNVLNGRTVTTGVANER